MKSTTGKASVSIKRDDGKVIGKVIGDCFCKNVQASRHFLKKPEAIAFDVSTLMQAQQAGAVFVCVTDSESGKLYRATLHAVLQAGFTFDRGHGSQVALPIARWTVAGDVGYQMTFPF